MSNTNATRLIRGTILRCTDGKWSDTLGGDPPPLLIALGTTQALQCWKDSKPTDVVMAEKGKPLRPRGRQRQTRKSEPAAAEAAPETLTTPPRLAKAKGRTAKGQRMTAKSPAKKSASKKSASKKSAKRKATTRGRTSAAQRR